MASPEWFSQGDKTSRTNDHGILLASRAQKQKIVAVWLISSALLQGWIGMFKIFINKYLFLLW